MQAASYLTKNRGRARENLQALANAIKAYRAQQVGEHSHIVVPMGGSVLQEGIKNGTRLTNFGTTVLTIYKHGLVTGSIVIGPHDSMIIPDGWNSIDIKNGSATADGEFTL